MNGSGVVGRVVAVAEQKALQPLTRDQAHASRPDSHVWLSASAGTGKTAVLSSRVLRLLLQGVAPERILCLTFTKAGAAEMAERVHSRLARWVQSKGPEVAKDLIALGEDPGPDSVARARLLFAKVLDATGGGLRIQTIHSFCQALLAAFPLEAGLVPGFKPLDDRGQAELCRKALIAMIETAERDHDEAVLAAIEMLALRLGEAGTQAYLQKCVSASAELDLMPDDISAALLEYLDLPAGDVEAELARACADDAFPVADLRRVAAANVAWGAKSGLDCADLIARWVAAGEAGRVEALEDLLGALLTKDGEVKNRNRDKLLDAEPDYVALATLCGDAIRAMLDLRRQVAFARLAAQGLTAGRAYARAYAQAKRQAGAVDFDDLIGRASHLLTQQGMADWIRYKLDQRIDHILVDEAQDTNEAQWDIVWAIIGEFFAVEDDGFADLRTLFVVGDTKQAIFGFQGTSPLAFSNARSSFAQAARQAGQPFAELPLRLSFRSMPAVLDVVDALLDEVGHDQLGLEAPSARHESARRHPGRILLLPPTSLIRADEDESEEGGEPREEEQVEGEEDWLADHQRLHAEKIAQLVKGMIGAPLATTGHPARPGDILILLRSRGALSRLIVARLYEAGVPVAGVDRLRLQAPLAVQDLLAALRFAVQPEDDLNLANLLVSPLIGWSQDDLMVRAIRPLGRSLWSHLRETLAHEDQAPLRTLLGSADFSTPYRYLEAILSGAMDGRRKLVARLGEEARDAIDELINAALAFEADDHPSLQRFIDWFDRGDADIKRELGEGGDLVRVMTVHGSKGLEAPIVILADAAFDPGAKPRADAVKLPVTVRAALPLVRPGKGEAAPAIEEAMKAAEALDMQEHWRLLYVGLTRAEEQLIVTGALGGRAKGVPPEQSWYDAVDRAMRRLGAAPESVEGWGEGKLWLGPDNLSPVQPDRKDVPQLVEMEAERPAWLRAPAPAEARPPRPLAPSASVEDDVPNPPPDEVMRRGAERGRLLHALFERLPDVDPAERAEAAGRWLMQTGGVVDAEERQDLIDHVQAVLDDPSHAALFGPDALAEAPIAAVVDGQVIAGTVDRLLVTRSEIHIVDFKTGQRVPRPIDEIPLSHARQMAAYAAALRVIFPGRKLRVSLLYTAQPLLVDLPAALLEAHKPRFGQAEQFLSPTGLETEPNAD